MHDNITESINRLQELKDYINNMQDIKDPNLFIIGFRLGIIMDIIHDVQNDLISFNNNP